MSTLVQSASASFTRPNDTVQYTLNDLIANSTTPGSVVPLQFNNLISGTIVRCAMYKSSSNAIQANFRIHFWSQTAPIVSAGDNDTLVLPTFSNYYGFLQLNNFAAMSTGSVDITSSSANSVAMPFIGNTLFAYLQAIDAYQPIANEQFTIRIEYQSLTRNQRWDVTI